ncbi:hypothetical protein GOODEAATRI_034125 [Goodea atripinnis]|uniref:Uncharacterized protein n=1 Tax=Goodea atripinnis TaxID=208336 RepID=A0ABV0PUB4_9TELE
MFESLETASCVCHSALKARQLRPSDAAVTVSFPPLFSELQLHSTLYFSSYFLIFRHNSFSLCHIYSIFFLLLVLSYVHSASHIYWKSRCQSACFKLQNETKKCLQTP